MKSRGTASRLRVAHSWWLASELVRRHPELRLAEMHTGGGQADVLQLFGAGDRWVIGINRREGGGIHFLSSGRPSIPFDDFFVDEDPYGFLQRLEGDAGLVPRQKSLPSSPTILAYRSAALLTMATVGAREPLDVRNHFIDTSGPSDSGVSGGLNEFPLAKAASEKRRADDLDDQPAYRYWLILRGHAVVAVLDTDGNLYQERQVHSLALAYAVHNRNLTATLSFVAPSLLP